MHHPCVGAQRREGITLRTSRTPKMANGVIYVYNMCACIYADGMRISVMIMDRFSHLIIIMLLFISSPLFIVFSSSIPPSPCPFLLGTVLMILTWVPFPMQTSKGWWVLSLLLTSLPTAQVAAAVVVEVFESVVRQYVEENEPRRCCFWTVLSLMDDHHNGVNQLLYTYILYCIVSYFVGVCVCDAELFVCYIMNWDPSPPPATCTTTATLLPPYVPKQNILMWLRREKKRKRFGLGH